MKLQRTWILVSAVLLSVEVLAQECPAPEDRIDCHPENGANEDSCIDKGCSWCRLDSVAGVPSCYVPSDYGYRLESSPDFQENGISFNLVRSRQDVSYFGDDIERIKLEVFYRCDKSLRMKIYDPNTDRFEVPLKVNQPKEGPGTNDTAMYSVEWSNDPVFSFRVVRKSTGKVIFDTGLGGTTFSNQFLQLSILLPSNNSYGFGEHEQHTFRHDFSSYQVLPMWAEGSPPNGNDNLYGVQPYYTVVEDIVGNTHSVMIVNSNAQEVVLTPKPAFIYRTIGGILDLYLYMGPTPEETVQQFTQAVGRQGLPPYWGLGYQLSRWGYNHIDNMKRAVDRTEDYNIPHDVQYLDIDGMHDYLTFTYDNVTFPNLPQYVQELKSKGIKFVTILDPGISYLTEPGTYPGFDLGEQLDVWIKRPDGSPATGSVWPGPTYFPDYSRPSARTYWMTLIKDFYQVIQFDGLWIDMNEPDSTSVGDYELGGCPQSPLNYPPYLPGVRQENIFTFTLCPDSQQDFGLHYDTHSLYGWSESEPTLSGVREALGTRGLVLSRSTFLGSGQWAAHWLGDNYSYWSNLYYSIIGMLQFNQFGIPYVGADICGFFNDTTAEMCIRWHQLGAWYPFSRNHNANGTMDQDPGYFGPEVANIIKKNLETRYTFLPYMYTQFFYHTTRGNTVVRALWHEFPGDSEALGVDRQFLWGAGLLISPVLEPSSQYIPVYFPDARWYNYYNGQEVLARGKYVTLGAPLDFINIHLRGGIIYTTQQPARNTQLSRNNPFSLIVALDDDANSSGQLYYDDGDSTDPQLTGRYFLVEYTYSFNYLTVSIINNAYPEMATKRLNRIQFYGFNSYVHSVLLNGEQHTDFHHDAIGNQLDVYNLNLVMNERFELQVVQ